MDYNEIVRKMTASYVDCSCFVVVTTEIIPNISYAV